MIRYVTVGLVEWKVPVRNLSMRVEPLVRLSLIHLSSATPKSEMVLLNKVKDPPAQISVSCLGPREKILIVQMCHNTSIINLVLYIIINMRKK